MYKAYLRRSAEKDLKKLGQKSQVLVIRAIRDLELAPRLGRKLKDPKIGTYRYRIGDYRVVYDIDDHRKEIHILRIRHRRDVYR